MMYPNFLCIGTPKSGTTWLDAQFRAHPGLWLPPIKELHHFDCSGTAPWGLYYRFDKGIQYNIRRAAKQCLNDMWARPGNASWYFRYFFLRRTDEWYAGLFSPKKHQVAGEITPAYCRLEEQQVANIHGLMPDLKIILILRNPVERFWSNLAMYFSKYGFKGIGEVPDAEIFAMFDSQMHQRSAQYHKTIEMWRRYYPEEQIFIAFFEQISTQPQDLLESIYDFLEVSKQKLTDSGRLTKKINHRQYPTIPEHFKIQLHRLFQTEIELIHRMFDNEYSRSWLEENQSVLSLSSSNQNYFLTN